MSEALTAEAPPRPALRERLASNADGILEQIAREYGVSTFDVVEALPFALRTIVSGSNFEKILTTLTSWGAVVFIVHTADIVLECEGRIPPGTFARGYFNLHGDSPIGGHIKAENCTSIAFVMRPFMGRESRSIQFFNTAGEAMFKIFVRRDENRELIAEQVQLFDALRADLTG
ncbi:MAG TPA: heme utilization cystosolic carrier protein HutX [Hyphomicrobium sp.]|nr:heme utilization cystosolic carrier protein HutX [Hyphomicrobium sp.]